LWGIGRGLGRKGTGVRRVIGGEIKKGKRRRDGEVREMAGDKKEGIKVGRKKGGRRGRRVVIIYSKPFLALAAFY